MATHLFSPLTSPELGVLQPAQISRAFREDLLALAPPGTLLELSGRARTSLAARLLGKIQAEGDPVAWVTGKGAGLYPPDLAEAGLDLDRLVVVRIPEGEEARRGPQAAELLLRTGAFGAVVLDTVPGLGERHARQGPLPRFTNTQRATAWQGRLSGILRTHEARLILLTESEPAGQKASREVDEIGPSMGPLVSVRLLLERERLPNGELRIVPRVVKDKSGSLEGMHAEAEIHRGPAGSRVAHHVHEDAHDEGDAYDDVTRDDVTRNNVRPLRRAR